MSVPQNVVMDLNNVTRSDGREFVFMRRGICSEENAFIALQTS